MKTPPTFSRHIKVGTCERSQHKLTGGINVEAGVNNTVKNGSINTNCNNITFKIQNFQAGLTLEAV